MTSGDSWRVLRKAQEQEHAPDLLGGVPDQILSPEDDPAAAGVKVVQVMREGFAVAIREDALIRSPLEKLDPRELPKPRSSKRPRRLDKAELDALLDAAKAKTPVSTSCSSCSRTPVCASAKRSR